MKRSILLSTLFIAACGGTADDLYDQTASALSAVSRTEDSSKLLDVKITWKGDVGRLSVEVEGDKDGDWKVEESGMAGVSKVNGKIKYVVKTESKDKESGDKTKYHFDYEAHYHDVLIRSSDQMIIGGTIDYDIKGKVSEKTDDTNIKEEWKIKGTATFSEDGQGDLVLDESYKYKVKVDGQATFVSKS
jgi:hypothetical protein